MVKFYLFYNKLVNLKTKKITNFKLIRLHLQNKIILKKMFISTTSHISIPNKYVAVRSGQFPFLFVIPFSIIVCCLFLTD